MKLETRVQLSIMMFLEFFVWGGWFVSLGTFLGSNLQASNTQIGYAFSTQSWGAIIAPFVIGLIADRYFNAEKILGVFHIIGAGLLYLMSVQSDFASFYPLVFAYMVLYMPTLALVNSVAFNQMSDIAQDFSTIRVWGTIGWIVAGILISFFSWDNASNIASGAMKNTFVMSALASGALGIWSFFLPATPPKASRSEKIRVHDLLGLDAIKLLSDKNYLVFFITSVLICIPLAFYYQITNPFLAEIGLTNPTGKMTIGQGSEVLFMLLLPIFLKRFGLKITLLAGMLSWCLRYILFAYGNAGELSFMLIIGIALHGICYDFFFVTGQIYTDSKAGEHIKSAAQGLITLATYGVGMLIGYQVASAVMDHYTLGSDKNWEGIWTFPALFAAGVCVLLIILFKNERIKTENTL